MQRISHAAYPGPEAVLDHGPRLERATTILARAVGGTAICAVASLALLFAGMPQFGALNDAANAALGVLSAALAFNLRRQVGLAAIGLAVAGAAVTMVGSWLVMSGQTGFLLAGLVSSAGFALIGAWLIALNLGLRARRAAPDVVTWLGLVAGALMVVGIAALPGIVLALDDLATAPGWIWLGFFGWLGVYVAYPVWALSLQRS